jgi:hypothetical protein
MKRCLFLLTVLFLTNKTDAQYLFSMEHPMFDIVYLNRGDSVLVKGISYVKNIELEPIRYHNRCDTIQRYYPAYDYDSINRRPCNFYQHTPQYIPIRNNAFKISISQWDSTSILYDSLNRVKEVFDVNSQYYGTGTFHMIFYKNDTSIFEYVYNVRRHAKQWLIGKTPMYHFEKYYLDTFKNIISMETGSLENPVDSTTDFDKVPLWGRVEFQYDYPNGKIVRTKCFENDELLYSQYFYYKNGRPFKSVFYDEKRKKVKYKLLYVYNK